mmetsp:Transcript_35283/g.110255  ORF Transcript_35283/g.110255 Transcript_35283/m.110255 type:complete len:762 (-) Transcript_35283:1164-3449(-)
MQDQHCEHEEGRDEPARRKSIHDEKHEANTRLSFLSLDTFVHKREAENTQSSDKQEGDEVQEGEEEEPATKKLPLLLLNPFSVGHVLWDTWMVVITIYYIIIIPFKITFVDSQSYRCDAQDVSKCPGFWWQSFFSDSSWLYVDFVMDFMFMTDILVNFLTSYHLFDAKGTKYLVTDRRQIALKYLRTWFFIDLIASFPFDFIFYLLNLYTNGSIIKLLKSLRFLKLIRLWRVGRMMHVFQEVFDMNYGLILLMQILLIFSLLAHYLSCYFFSMGALLQTFRVCSSPAGEESICRCYESANEANCVPTTWITEKSFMLPSGEMYVVDMDVNWQYLCSIYWVVTTMSTVGFGDIVPVTDWEVLMCIVAQVLGATTFGFIVGNMSTLTESFDTRKEEMKNQIEDLQAYLYACGVPFELVTRLIQDIRYNYLHPISEAKKEIIDVLPRNIALQIAKHVFKFAIDDSSIFMELSQRSLEELYFELQCFHVEQGQSILTCGDMSKSIVFLIEGVGSVKSSPSLFDAAMKKRKLSMTDLAADHVETYLTVRPCYFLGENCLLTGKEIFPYECTAATWCQLLRLEVKSLLNILSSDELSYVRAAAKVRYSRFLALITTSMSIKESSKKGVKITRSKKRQQDSQLSRFARRVSFRSDGQRPSTEEDSSEKTMTAIFNETKNIDQTTLIDIKKFYTSASIKKQEMVWGELLEYHNMKGRIDEELHHERSLAKYNLVELQYKYLEHLSYAADRFVDKDWLTDKVRDRLSHAC